MITGKITKDMRDLLSQSKIKIDVKLKLTILQSIQHYLYILFYFITYYKAPFDTVNILPKLLFVIS